MVKNPPANAGDADVGLVAWLGISPGKKWQLTPVFLPGESPWTEEHNSFSPQGLKESDMT